MGRLLAPSRADFALAVAVLLIPIAAGWASIVVSDTAATPRPYARLLQERLRSLGRNCHMPNYEATEHENAKTENAHRHFLNRSGAARRRG